MLGVYIFVGVCILGVIIFTIWCINLLLVSQIKMQKAGVGGRTKFIVDTTDKGYDYYERFVNEWLESNKFSSYNKKNNGRILKYYIGDLIFRFGFNHYKDGQNMIIETWLYVFGQENPLSFKSYSHKEGTVDIASGLATGELKSNNETSILVNQQGKDEYLIFLSSLINMPETIQDSNNVTLKDKYDKQNQKSKIRKEKKSQNYIYNFSY